MSTQLERFRQDGRGTLGELTIHEKGFEAVYATLERPWLGNQAGISCIPTGTYTVRKHVSPSKGECFRLDPEQVAPRTDVLMHIGNYCPADTLGCLLVGKGFNGDAKKFMVVSSAAAMREMLARMPDEWTLAIRGGQG